MQPSYWYQQQTQPGSVAITNYIIHENNRLRAQVSRELNKLRTQISEEIIELREEIAREAQTTRDLIVSLFSKHAPTFPLEALRSEAPTVPETVQNKRKSPESSSETPLESAPEPKRNNILQETNLEVSVEASNEDSIEEIIEEILLDDSDSEQEHMSEQSESSDGQKCTSNVKLIQNTSGSFPTADTHCQTQASSRFLLVSDACKHLMTPSFISRVCQTLEPSHVFRKNISGPKNGSPRLLLTKSGVSKFVEIAKKRYLRNQDPEHREDVFVLLDVIDSWSKEHISEQCDL